MPTRQKLWTRAYSLLCASLFLVSGQQAMVLVVLPLYVTHLGGSAFVAGLVLFAFSLPSFSSRPIVGYWADTWSLAGVFTVGGLVLGLSTSFYLLPVVAAVAVVSVVRGLGWAGAMTGSYALLAQLSPTERRGEASGYFSSVFSATNILFPALGLWLIGAGSGRYGTVFVVASLLAFGSAVLSHLWLRPAVPDVHADLRTARPGLAALALERSVLLPTVLSLSLTLAQPAVIAFLPLYAKHQGISNIASYFVLSGVASLAIRPVLGRVDDRFGHGYSMVAGFLAQMAGVVLIMTVGTLPAILVGGVLNALGNAVCNAAVVGLAVALADPKRRGAAMATFTISFQLGNGIGSVLAGALVSIAGFGGMYGGSLVVLAVGLLLALKSWARLGPMHVAARPELESAG
jgi:MFS family permease